MAAEKLKLTKTALLACDVRDLAAAGFTLRDLAAAGFTLRDLRAAGFTLRELAAAGFTLRDLRAAGFTLRDLAAAGFTPDDLARHFGVIPLVRKPYTRLLADIRAKKRAFDQSTFGPNDFRVSDDGICGTPMCTAGHLVQMAGAEGWALKERFDFAGAARLIHEKAHPDWPCQNFGAIPNELALAYIEEMAEHEENGTSPVVAP